MNQSDIKFASEWLEVAQEDLQWAKASFKDGFFSRVCFVCHQIIEKSLKGYLYANRRESKSHDLVGLLKICTTIDSNFTQLKNEVKFLNPCYIGTRYPDEGDVRKFQDKIIAKRAIETASMVQEFVMKKLAEARGHD